MCIRDRWHDINEQQFEFEQSDTCPTCGQALPAEQLESAREKALAEFNRQKAEKLETISAEGKQFKARADDIKAEINGLREKMIEARKRLQSLSLIHISSPAQFQRHPGFYLGCQRQIA